jgi:uncharacterized protein (DUF4415 family)
MKHSRQNDFHYEEPNMNPNHPNYDPETIYEEPAKIRVRLEAEIVDWFKARSDDPIGQMKEVLRAYMAAQDKG